jgi:hypothetical protein
MKYETTPLGLWRKREPQNILKTDERNLLLEVGLEGNSSPKQCVGTKTRYSSKGTSSRSRAWVPTNLPARPRPAVELLRPIFRTTGTALQSG